MQTRDLENRCDEVTLRGHLVWDETITKPRPGVAVFHEGLGLGDFAMERARMLAELGYVVLAADMSWASIRDCLMKCWPDKGYPFVS